MFRLRNTAFDRKKRCDGAIVVLEALHYRAGRETLKLFVLHRTASHGNYFSAQIAVVGGLGRFATEYRVKERRIGNAEIDDLGAFRRLAQ